MRVPCCRAILLPVLLVGQVTPGHAQREVGTTPTLGTRPVFLDKDGVVRWKDNRQEVALFGANYVIHTASDYRAAGYVHGDRRVGDKILTTTLECTVSVESLRP